MLHRPATLALILLLTATLAACAGRRTPPPDDALEQPEQLFEAMIARLDAVQAVRARAVMEYYGAGGRVRVRQTVLAAQPNLLRIDTLSPFDSTLSVVFANDRELVLYDLPNEAWYTGAPTATNLARLIPVWLSPQDVVSVLLGGPPLDRIVPDASRWTLDWDRRRGAYRFTAPTRGGDTLVLFVTHGAWTVVGAQELDAAERVRWEIRSADFSTVHAGDVATTVPGILRFLMKSENIDVSLNVSSYELNPTLGPTLFQLPVPPGVRVFPLDAVEPVELAEPPAE